MSALSDKLITKNRVNTDIKMSCLSLITEIIVELLTLKYSLPYLGSTHCMKVHFNFCLMAIEAL